MGNFFKSLVKVYEVGKNFVEKANQEAEAKKAGNQNNTQNYVPQQGSYIPQQTSSIPQGSNEQNATFNELSGPYVLLKSDIPKTQMRTEFCDDGEGNPLADEGGLIYFDYVYDMDLETFSDTQDYGCGEIHAQYTYLIKGEEYNWEKDYPLILIEEMRLGKDKSINDQYVCRSGSELLYSTMENVNHPVIKYRYNAFTEKTNYYYCLFHRDKDSRERDYYFAATLIIPAEYMGTSIEMYALKVLDNMALSMHIEPKERSEFA